MPYFADEMNVRGIYVIGTPAKEPGKMIPDITYDWYCTPEAAERKKEAQKTVIDMSSDEFEAACQEAVAQRTDVPVMDYVTRIDKESGMIAKIYEDGRVDYVLD